MLDNANAIGIQNFAKEIEQRMISLVDAEN